MKTSLLLLLALALTLVFVIDADQPVGASTGIPDTLETRVIPPIRSLQRSTKNEPADAGSIIRDPFFLPAPPPDTSEAPIALDVQAAAPPQLPVFQILGKQEDDAGWAVFVSSPDKPGEVWVVREGENFNENFRVSKLLPPVLIIKNTRSRQSRTFNIGKEEDEY